MPKKSRAAAFFRSLKLRIVLILLFIAILPGIALYWGVTSSYTQRAVSLRESEVLGQAKILANQIATSGYLSDPKSGTDTLQAEISMLTTIYNGRVVIIDGQYRIISDTYDLDTGKTIISREVVECFTGTDEYYYDEENDYLEMTVPIRDTENDSAKVLGVLLVSVSMDSISMIRGTIESTTLIILLIMGLLTVFFGVLIVLYMLKPFTRLTTNISTLHTGFGEELLEENAYTETKAICDSVNRLLVNIRNLEESRQEFVANVSHELKTPMTSIKVLADTLNSMPDAPLEMYQEFMGDITHEIDRENTIISDLLSMVKLDKSSATLNIEKININDLLEKILKRLHPIAEKQRVELVLESFRPVTAEIDEVKMTLAITNLVENGIKYNKNDGTGWVHVSLNADHQFFYIKVEDSGIGIPEEDLERIYERFFRVDKSHSREIGGTGLGLAITKRSILMHHGEIKAHSILGEGTTFDVRIPLTYIAK